ncbi:hypothetical protein HDZ31DRAFT_80091 [Schizophyllum fasciatum]
MSQQPLFGDRPGVKISFAGAAAATILRPMRYGRRGIDENSFHAAPNALITLLPRIRGAKIPYERYTTFYRDWTSSSMLVFYAEAVRSDKSAPRRKFALKVALNVTGSRCTGGGAFMENLRREAIFYHERLAELQGVAVPKHYGVWIGRTPWDTTIACAIMEWGGQPYSSGIVDPVLGKPERSFTVMQAIKALHDVGFQHNDLIDLRCRHFLYDTEREKAFIIDFSTAEPHRCRLRMKMKAYKTPPLPSVFGCEELCDMAIAVQYFGEGPSFGPKADPEVQLANMQARPSYLACNELELHTGLHVPTSTLGFKGVHAVFHTKYN